MKTSNILYSSTHFVIVIFVFILTLSTKLADAETITKNSLSKPIESYNILYPTQVNQLLKEINPQEMWTNLIVLTQFPERSAMHQSGVRAAAWLKSHLEIMVENSGRDDVNVYTIETGKQKTESGITYDFPQPSVVMKIGTSSEPGIIIGAHLDTCSCRADGKEDNDCQKDPTGPLPGANDDGSGVVTIMEAAKTLLASQMHFKKPIYFIWYAAEEGGTVGSGVVINQFKEKNLPVAAVMQLDQVGYAKNNDMTMWLDPQDDKNLTNYLQILITTYLKRPVKISSSGGSSDDEQWRWAGFVTARPLEGDYHGSFYPYSHTNQDTIDKVSLTHMTDYLKLAVAFAVELAEPISS